VTVNEVDKLDLVILSMLKDDGRKSFSEIARELDVSNGTVRYRVSSMLENQILQIVGRFDPHRVGLRAPANVRVAVRPAHLIDEVAARVASLPEVQYVAMLAGEYDLELDVMCRDNAHLSEFITERLHTLEGIDHTETNLILRVYKHASADLDAINQMASPENPTDESHSGFSNYR